MDRIPILVTGGAGMLGVAFADTAARHGRFLPLALSRTQLDVRDPDAVMEHIDAVRGGWIIHCAAMVDVKRCAQEPEVARATIVDGARNVVELAKAAHARLLFPQSFLVYSGGEGLIGEDVAPEPLSLYGQLKLEAEEVVSNALADPLIVRMAGFFGGEAADKNFVGRIIPTMHRAMQSGQRTFAVGDRVWQPTWTEDLAENSLHLMEVGAAGVYQMASHGEAAFHEIAQHIVSCLGWGDRLVIESVSAGSVAADETGPERRPDRAVMACERLRRERRDLQRDWRATLGAYLARPFFDQYRLGS